MLHELRVENLLLLDRAELRMAPGLNVLTGETGAGKTLLAHALDLLLGGRARSGTVRGGAKEAYVEGVFSLPSELGEREELPPELGDRQQLLPAGAEEIVLARRVWPDGRTRAYVCGRSATVGDLRELGSRLLTFYGQHEHRKLMLATAQLEILDSHCGAEQLERRAGIASAYERVRGLEDRVEKLRELAGARERELDLLAFELQEIEAAAPREDEAAALAEERERLRHAETLRGSAAAAAESIFPDGETGAPDGDAGAAQALAQAGRQLEAGAAIDPALAELAERVRALAYEAEDAGRELRSYALGVEGAPGRLEEVEERLALLARLERKHGGSIEEVLRHGERCRERIGELEGAEVALAGAEAGLAEARSGLDALAREVGEARGKAAPRLARAVRERLAELAMPDARFKVVLGPRPDGCGPRGADTVELLISTNAGVPAGPLREIASGGELSRVMLALLSVAHGGAQRPPAHGCARRPPAHRGARPAAADAAASPGATDAPLLVFDEIDAGIGGHTARAVGEHLRELAVGRQILCITHLPQVAALAGRHFTIAKDSSTVPATTTVTALDGKAVVNELVRMLGAGEGDRAASQHARQLLRRAA